MVSGAKLLGRGQFSSFCNRLQFVEIFSVYVETISAYDLADRFEWFRKDDALVASSGIIANYPTESIFNGWGHPSTGPKQ